MNDNQKLVGDNIIDYNGDGVIDKDDVVPDIPAHRRNLQCTIGFRWKASAARAVHGVNNVTRDVVLSDFGSNLDTVYDKGCMVEQEQHHT